MNRNFSLKIGMQVEVKTEHSSLNHNENMPYPVYKMPAVLESASSVLCVIDTTNTIF